MLPPASLTPEYTLAELDWALHQILRDYFKIPGVPEAEQVVSVKLWMLVYMRWGTLKIWPGDSILAWRYLSELTEETVMDAKRFDPFGPDMWVDFAFGDYDTFIPYAKGAAFRNIGWTRAKTGKDFICHKDELPIRSTLRSRVAGDIQSRPPYNSSLRT
jgi:hypothetical protein